MLKWTQLNKPVGHAKLFTAWKRSCIGGIAWRRSYIAWRRSCMAWRRSCKAWRRSMILRTATLI
jgi:hypothetical protein